MLSQTEFIMRDVLSNLSKKQVLDLPVADLTITVHSFKLTEFKKYAHLSTENSVLPTNIVMCIITRKNTFSARFVCIRIADTLQVCIGGGAQCLNLKANL